jgi:hypothetical protein
MPNWCYNEVAVTGSQKELDRFKKRVAGLDIHSKDSDFTFQQITGMPDLIRQTSSPVHAFETMEEVERYNEEHKRMADFIGQSLAMTLEHQRMLLESFGHDNWYSWANEKWGTKWDCSNVEMWAWDGELEYTFNTAWCPPEPIWKFLVKEFPMLEIQWFYRGEGDEFAGYLGVEEQAV